MLSIPILMYTCLLWCKSKPVVLSNTLQMVDFFPLTCLSVFIYEYRITVRWPPLWLLHCGQLLVYIFIDGQTVASVFNPLVHISAFEVLISECDWLYNCRLVIKQSTRLVLKIYFRELILIKIAWFYAWIIWIYLFYSPDNWRWLRSLDVHTDSKM